MPRELGIGRWPLVLLVAVATFGLMSVACGDDDDDDGGGPAAPATRISIVDPSARAVESGNSAVYFTIKNTGAADRLISVSSAAAKEAQVHETVMSGGTASMQKLENGLEVPAQGEVVLKPGGYHIMLLDITAPLKVGDKVELKLKFENAGEIAVWAPVQSYPGMSGSMGR